MPAVYGRTLLKLTSGLEIVTGLLFLFAPALPISWLFGDGAIGALASIVGRAFGAALIPLGAACWWTTRDPERSPGVMIKTMLSYNVLVTAVFVYAFAAARLVGFLLWPAIVVHVALAIWCVAAIRRLARSCDGPN